MTEFSSTKPIFPTKDQLEVIRVNRDSIEMMQSATDVESWNLLRDVIKSQMRNNI